MIRRLLLSAIFLFFGCAPSGTPCKTEDFETRMTGVSECLLIRRYGFSESMSPHAMLVRIHGDVSSGGPASYHFALAQSATTHFANQKILSVALVRPGYPDGSGNASSGYHNGRSDHYTSENISEVGGVVEKLRRRLQTQYRCPDWSFGRRSYRGCPYGHETGAS